MECLHRWTITQSFMLKCMSINLPRIVPKEIALVQSTRRKLVISEIVPCTHHLSTCHVSYEAMCEACLKLWTVGCQRCGLGGPYEWPEKCCGYNEIENWDELRVNGSVFMLTSLISVSCSILLSFSSDNLSCFFRSLSLLWRSKASFTSSSSFRSYDIGMFLLFISFDENVANSFTIMREQSSIRFILSFFLRIPRGKGMKLCILTIFVIRLSAAIFEDFKFALPYFCPTDADTPALSWNHEKVWFILWSWRQARIQTMLFQGEGEYCEFFLRNFHWKLRISRGGVPPPCIHARDDIIIEFEVPHISAN